MHILLLTAGLLTLGIHLQAESRQRSPTILLVTVFRVLTTVIGLPFLALSATTPLLTAWYAGSFEDRSPYRLFALSNFASLLALVSYPLLIEPRLTMNQQTAWWSSGFLLFAVLAGAIAWQRRRQAPETSRQLDRLRSTPSSQAYPDRLLVWLPMAGGMMLTAVTSHMSANIAAIPCCGCRPWLCIC